eukprot:CAMPEP_0174375238 /NCGR_PEP_ID=MMETSP0811_2-20130205/113846_1 /TAXON_ID=73025 ORGANISM="Eutreptiella gymnastica-like, Strain CCMP1594" /NCGR_SAMPLE_ID=MMETSP0811_2 /ASSEMBLY_ACC=CAM_ASM_000667 /LENGTH=64 /DNA_ID=CAMNT_0015525289 /DNA_START=156 /DNA_END=350 /DNA_ORIENTATION=+
MTVSFGQCKPGIPYVVGFVNPIDPFGDLGMDRPTVWTAPKAIKIITSAIWSGCTKKNGGLKNPG